jgi:hypothetical protein
MHMTIKIGAVGDPPLYPEIGQLVQDHSVIESVGILEAGMQSGKTSLSFNVKLTNGRYVVAEMSAGMFLQLAGAVRGAVERFEGAK